MAGPTPMSVVTSRPRPITGVHSRGHVRRASTAANARRCARTPRRGGSRQRAPWPAHRLRRPARSTRVVKAGVSEARVIASSSPSSASLERRPSLGAIRPLRELSHRPTTQPRTRRDLRRGTGAPMPALRRPTSRPAWGTSPAWTLSAPAVWFRSGDLISPPLRQRAAPAGG